MSRHATSSYFPTEPHAICHSIGHIISRSFLVSFTGCFSWWQQQHEMRGGNARVGVDVADDEVSVAALGSVGVVHGIADATAARAGMRTGSRSFMLESLCAVLTSDNAALGSASLV